MIINIIVNIEGSLVAACAFLVALVTVGTFLAALAVLDIPLAVLDIPLAVLDIPLVVHIPLAIVIPFGSIDLVQLVDFVRRNYAPHHILRHIPPQQLPQQPPQQLLREPLHEPLRGDALPHDDVLHDGHGLLHFFCIFQYNTNRCLYR